MDKSLRQLLAQRASGLLDSDNPLKDIGMAMQAFNNSPDGDFGSSFPASDASDLNAGARFIPGEVTLERRAGRRVEFHIQCTHCCWYWETVDGLRVYHFDRYTFDSIMEGKAPCPHCGNIHVFGGTFLPHEIGKMPENIHHHIFSYIRQAVTGDNEVLAKIRESSKESADSIERGRSLIKPENLEIMRQIVDGTYLSPGSFGGARLPSIDDEWYGEFRLGKAKR